MIGSNNIVTIENIFRSLGFSFFASHFGTLFYFSKGLHNKKSSLIRRNYTTLLMGERFSTILVLNDALKSMSVHLELLNISLGSKGGYQIYSTNK